MSAQPSRSQSEATPNHAGGRVAVVTGGGTGIGRAIARRLARDGARVAIAGRDAARLGAVAAETGARAYCLDIREEQSCNDVLGRIAMDLGPISIFVANAGIGGVNEPGSRDRWREIVATNMDGTYFSVRAAIANLAGESLRRDIVIVSSILGKFGVPGYSAYCATKAGLIGLTRSLALELAPKRVAVNAICPGWVETEMALDGLRGMASGMGVSLEAARARAMESVPFRKMSQPEEVASLVAWMTSPECVGMTGQSINLNQGAFME
ncbi:MAG: SDR family oxidoreductase [Planctomycetes bacterium]|nr:SDR family oxidoreductase [Planctomycetota bacterium]